MLFLFAVLESAKVRKVGRVQSTHTHNNTKYERKRRQFLLKPVANKKTMPNVYIYCASQAKRPMKKPSNWEKVLMLSTTTKHI